MRRDPRPLPPVTRVAALDLDLLRSKSVLIYARSSFVLSLLLYSCILAMLYSDLYVHLIRQARDAFQHLRVLPGAVYLVAVAGAAILSLRVKPLLEKTALSALALNVATLYLRRNMAGHSDAYLGMCVVSLVLDLALLASVVAFYRKYPNALNLLRRRARE
ncbi:MAG TPA: hypothetical protein VGR38_00155 [Candidatus Polarisedimenticolia bacterium]|nr:hypothetical protein [Candidatus Polarisedimenticolia bacterium]